MFRLLSFLAAFSLASIALLGPLERKMIYQFDTTRVSPAAAGVPGLRETTLQSGDETLVLWVARAKPNKPTVLYFHGNAGNLANRAGRFQRFLDRGYGVIAPAYRGSSGSTGTPDQPALTTDAALVYAQIVHLLPDTNPETIVVYGESLGTGVAISLISTLGTQPAGLVLEAPFTSIPDIALNSYPQFEPLLHLITNRWDSLSLADTLTLPLLVLHGDQDSLIPIEMGRQIFTAAPSAHKRFFTVKAAGHTTIWRTDSLPVLWRFIDQ